MLNNFVRRTLFLMSLFLATLLFACSRDSMTGEVRSQESLRASKQTDRKNDDNEYLEFLPFYTIT